MGGQRRPRRRPGPLARPAADDGSRLSGGARLLPRRRGRGPVRRPARSGPRRRGAAVHVIIVAGMLRVAAADGDSYLDAVAYVAGVAHLPPGVWTSRSGRL